MIINVLSGNNTAIDAILHEMKDHRTDMRLLTGSQSFFLGLHIARRPMNLDR